MRRGLAILLTVLLVPAASVAAAPNALFASLHGPGLHAVIVIRVTHTDEITHLMADADQSFGAVRVTGTAAACSQPSLRADILYHLKINAPGADFSKTAQLLQPVFPVPQHTPHGSLRIIDKAGHQLACGDVVGLGPGKHPSVVITQPVYSQGAGLRALVVGHVHNGQLAYCGVAGANPFAAPFPYPSIGWTLLSKTGGSLASWTTSFAPGDPVVTLSGTAAATAGAGAKARRLRAGLDKTTSFTRKVFRWVPSGSTYPSCL